MAGPILTGIGHSLSFKLVVVREAVLHEIRMVGDGHCLYFPFRVSLLNLNTNVYTRLLSKSCLKVTL